jgi:hypothetical protein
MTFVSLTRRDSIDGRLATVHSGGNMREEKRPPAVEPEAFIIVN